MQPDAILIVIGSNLAETLQQIARCPLVPEALSAVAPMDSFTQFDSFWECLGIYEHVARDEVRRNYVDRPMLIQLGGQFDSFLDLLCALSYRKGGCIHSRFLLWFCVPFVAFSQLQFEERVSPNHHQLETAQPLPKQIVLQL